MKRLWIENRTPRILRQDKLRERLLYPATKLANLHELEPLVEFGSPEGSHTTLFWIRESAKPKGDRI